jgi:hypothetical protein
MAVRRWAPAGGRPAPRRWPPFDHARDREPRFPKFIKFRMRLSCASYGTHALPLDKTRHSRHSDQAPGPSISYPEPSTNRPRAAPGTVALGRLPIRTKKENPLALNACESSIEAELRTKGLNAPRLTPLLIDAQIVAEQYYVFPGTTMTVCALTLQNGFVVVGESAAASPENFDEAIGRRIARENAQPDLGARGLCPQDAAQPHSTPIWATRGRAGHSLGAQEGDLRGRESEESRTPSAERIGVDQPLFVGHAVLNG